MVAPAVLSYAPAPRSAEKHSSTLSARLENPVLLASDGINPHSRALLRFCSTDSFQNHRPGGYDRFKGFVGDGFGKNPER